MVKVGYIALGLVLVATATFAENAAIKHRKEILKGFGDATKPIASMYKNKQPFDLTLVRATLAKYEAGSKELPGLFPEDSKTGDKTQAKAEIWDEKPKFEAEFDKLGSDSAAASKAIVDEASFRAVVPKLLGDCKTCHDRYREKD